MAWNWLKRLAGITEHDDAPTQSIIDKMFRFDAGPADARYLRTLFPQSIFTQKMTPARRRIIRETIQRLRPEQREIVYARGWNKGVRV